MPLGSVTLSSSPSVEVGVGVKVPESGRASWVNTEVGLSVGGPSLFPVELPSEVSTDSVVSIGSGRGTSSVGDCAMGVAAGDSAEVVGSAGLPIYRKVLLLVLKVVPCSDIGCSVGGVDVETPGATVVPSPKPSTVIGFHQTSALPLLAMGPGSWRSLFMYGFDV